MVNEKDILDSQQHQFELEEQECKSIYESSVEVHRERMVTEFMPIINRFITERIELIRDLKIPSGPDLYIGLSKDILRQFHKAMRQFI